MALTKYRLGDFLELFNERCGVPDLTVWDISGVNSDKEFFEPSKQAGSDTSNYKIVPPDYFACNLMHVGRDVVLPIALNHSGKQKIVSPAYTVFKIKDGTPLIKEYFFMMLKSEERDRYFWFHTDASVRDGMSWDDFCDLDVELPPIPIQKKYVDLYILLLDDLRSFLSARYAQNRDKLVFTSEVVADFVNDLSDQLIKIMNDLKADQTSFERLGISYEEKAFYDILVKVRDDHGFPYADEKCLILAKKIKELVDDKAQFADWSTRDDIKNQLNMDLTVLLYQNGYPPEWDEEVFEKVMEQAENFKKYSDQ